jgi:hypothetical protein
MCSEQYSAGEAVEAETKLCFWCVFSVTECNINQVTEDTLMQFAAFCTFRNKVPFAPCAKHYE